MFCWLHQPRLLHKWICILFASFPVLFGHYQPRDVYHSPQDAWIMEGACTFFSSNEDYENYFWGSYKDACSVQDTWLHLVCTIHTALRQRRTRRWMIKWPSKFNNWCLLCYSRVSSIVDSRIYILLEACSYIATYLRTKPKYQDFYWYHNYAYTRWII